MGVQLSALLLAGGGAAWIARIVWEIVGRRGGRRANRLASHSTVQVTAALAAAVLVLSPAWAELRRYNRRNASAIAAQRRADATQGAELGRLLAVIRRDGGGRVYAGEPTNWGNSFTVGAVPVFKYVESQDIDEVGYTLRTASLMTDPEYFFLDTDPSDYILFGIRYLLVPTGYAPPVRARLVARSGPYSLLTFVSGSFVHTATLAGTLTADRSNVGVRSIPLLHSHLAQGGVDLRVAWGPGQPQPLPGGARVTSPGSVLGTHGRLAAGGLSATVRLRSPGAVVLSASYDPDWTASVDGRPEPTVMVAPALVAVRVRPGIHRVVFRYRGYRGYALLFALCALTLFALCALTLLAFLAAGALPARRSRLHPTTGRG